MSPRPRHARRIGAVLLPLALVATLLSSGSIAGQQAPPDAPSAETLPVVASATVTVLGDGFIAAPTVRPVRTGECAGSEVGPVETAATASPDTAVRVDNRSCTGVSLTDVASTQMQEIDPETSLLLISGIGLEFDWHDLASACLDTELRSAPGCIAEANLARATAANSFFSWRAVLQQAHRAAPDATIAVLASPIPVSARPLWLGSSCCGQSTNAHDQIQGVFDTAGALRRAVAESLTEFPIIVVETDAVFEGHRMDDEDPWLEPIGDATGLPNALGVRALSQRIEPLMPVGVLPAEVVATPAEVVLVMGTTSADQGAIDAVSNGAERWFEQLGAADLSASVAVVPIRTSPAPVVEEPAEPVDVDEPAAPTPDGDDHASGPAIQESPSPLQVDPPPSTTTTTTTTTTTAPTTSTTTTTTTAPTTSTTTTTTTTTTAAPTTTTTMEPPPAPSFATNGLELQQQLDALATIDGITEVAQLSASLAVAIDLLTPLIERQDVLVMTNGLDLDSATDEDRASLVVLASTMPVSTTIVVDTVETATALTQLLSGSGVSVMVADSEETDGVLPAPEPTIVLVGVSVQPTIEAVRGQAVDVVAHIETDRPVEASVTWSIDGEVKAVGQRTSIPTDELADGEHQVAVTVSTERESLEATALLVVSADGDGMLSVDPCPNSFDSSDVDLDGDGRLASCDSDDDGDGLADTIDPCPTIQTDNLRDLDLDGLPDRCDGDIEDGPLADADGDTVANTVDNCPLVSQADQLDGDDDGIGDACEEQLSPACTIYGTNGNDRIRGTSGPDVICALGGDDTVTSLGGGDIVFGGDGDDSLHGGSDSDQLYGGNGDDVLYGNGDADLLIGGVGNDTIVGGYGADIIFGDRGADVIRGDDGPDVLMGGRGNDDIRGGPGTDTIAGGNGNDTIFGEVGADLINGGNGSDFIGGGRGNDTIITVQSNDVVRGGSEEDLIDAAPIRVT